MKEDSIQSNTHNRNITDNDSDLEFALRAINDLDFAESTEFKNWLGMAEDNKSLYEECLFFREAALNEDKPSLPDASFEWISFQDKIKHEEKAKNKRLWIYPSIVAAAVLFFAVINFWMQQTDKETKQSILKEEIALQTEDGDVIPVKKIDADKAKDMGLRKEHSGRYNVLNYHTMADDPHAKVQTYTLNIPRGRFYQLILDDGTQVWVNTDTKITYPSRFDSDKRVVELEGEAYFKVTKEKDRPFIVRTPYLTTRVMGTEFDVRAYQKEDASVTLVTGKVAVSGDNPENVVILNPGENAASTSSGLNVSEVDVKNYTSWVEGYFYYEEAPLKDIMKELSRWYNVEIVFVQPEAKNFRFKFWADRNETFEEAVSMLNEVGKVSIVMQTPNKAIVYSK